jgi:hypothetical protein
MNGEPIDEGGGKMLKSVVTVALLWGLSGVVGCSEAVGGVLEEHPGTYVLQTVDGQPLPYTQYDDAEFREELLSGDLVLEPDRDCFITVKTRYTNKRSGDVQVESDAADGTWEVRNGEISLTLYDDDEIIILKGPIGNGILTLIVKDEDSPTTRYVFQKR